jgi:hypothetical protein
MPSNGVGHKSDTEGPKQPDCRKVSDWYATPPRTPQLQIRDSRVVQVQAASVAKRHGALEAQPARE